MFEPNVNFWTSLRASSFAQKLGKREGGKMSRLAGYFWTKYFYSFVLYFILKNVLIFY